MSAVQRGQIVRIIDSLHDLQFLHAVIVDDSAG